MIMRLEHTAPISALLIFVKTKHVHTKMQKEQTSVKKTKPFSNTDCEIKHYTTSITYLVILEAITKKWKIVEAITV